jgi:hypothetical protein
MSIANEAPLDPEKLSNDIQGLVEVAQLVNAARDAMSDEIVTRIASTLSESLMLLDRLTRNEGLMRLLQVLDHPDSQTWLVALSESLNVATKEIATNPPATGGFMCLARVAREPGTQEGLRFVAALGKHISRSLREQHRHGGAG